MLHQTYLHWASAFLLSLPLAVGGGCSKSDPAPTPGPTPMGDGDMAMTMVPAADMSMMPPPDLAKPPPPPPDLRTVITGDLALRKLMWQKQTTGVLVPLNQIIGADPQNVYAVGQQSTVLFS